MSLQEVRTQNRVPPLQEILAVYGVIVLILYGWTLIHFFWQFPSWTYYLKIGEILAILAYSLTIDLLESLLTLSFPLILALILPRSWFGNLFVSRGSALTAGFLGYAMYLASRLTGGAGYPDQAVHLAPFVCVAITVLVFLTGHVVSLRKPLETFANNASIFPYVTIPLSVLSLTIVLVRNIH